MIEKQVPVALFTKIGFMQMTQKVGCFKLLVIDYFSYDILMR